MSEHDATQTVRDAAIVRRELNRVMAGLVKARRNGSMWTYSISALQGAQQALAWMLRDNAEAASSTFGPQKPKRAPSGKRSSKQVRRSTRKKGEGNRGK